MAHSKSKALVALVILAGVAQASWFGSNDSSDPEVGQDLYDDPLTKLNSSQDNNSSNTQAQDQLKTTLVNPSDNKPGDDPEDSGPLPPLRSTRRPFRKVQPALNLVTDVVVNFNELFYRFEDPKCDDNCKEKMFDIFKNLGSGQKISPGFEQIFVQKRADGSWPKGWSPYRESPGMRDPEVGGYGDRQGPPRRSPDQMDTVEGGEVRAGEKRSHSPLELFQGEEKGPRPTHFEESASKDPKRAEEEIRERLREKQNQPTRPEDDDSSDSSRLRNGKFFPRGDAN